VGIEKDRISMGSLPLPEFENTFQRERVPKDTPSTERICWKIDNPGEKTSWYTILDGELIGEFDTKQELLCEVQRVKLEIL
jgi:hypothetical protein